MPGVDLNLDLPSLSDTMAVVVAKLVAALSAVEDDLAGKVIPSEIDINAALSMAGNALTDVGSLQLVSGNPPTAAGSFYYASDGEFYIITAAGPIRVSLNGALDITSAGGIVGDYGHGNESVSYDNASGEYRFKESSTVWADIRLDDLILMGDNGSVRLGVDDAVTTDRQFIFKGLPTTGISALVYAASTSTLESAETTRVTNTPKVTSIDMTGNLYHGNRTVVQGLEGGIGSFSVGGAFIPQYAIVAGASVLTPFKADLICGISRIKSIAVVFENNSAPDLVVESITAPTTEAFIGGVVTGTNTVVDASHTKRTFTFATPTIVPANSRVMFRLTNTSGTTLNVFNIEVVYDAPAP